MQAAADRGFAGGADLKALYLAAQLAQQKGIGLDRIAQADAGRQAAPQQCHTLPQGLHIEHIQRGAILCGEVFNLMFGHTISFLAMASSRLRSVLPFSVSGRLSNGSSVRGSIKTGSRCASAARTAALSAAPV